MRASKTAERANDGNETKMNTHSCNKKKKKNALCLPTEAREREIKLESWMNIINSTLINVKQKDFHFFVSFVFIRNAPVAQLLGLLLLLWERERKRTHNFCRKLAADCLATLKVSLHLANNFCWLFGEPRLIGSTRRVIASWDRTCSVSGTHLEDEVFRLCSSPITWCDKSIWALINSDRSINRSAVIRDYLALVSSSLSSCEWKPTSQKLNLVTNQLPEDFNCLWKKSTKKDTNSAFICSNVFVVDD